MTENNIKSNRKHGQIFGIKISSTSKGEVLEFLRSRLETKERFFFVTPNPEITLMARKDWLLKKTIAKSDLSIPDGIGLKFAFKFLYGEDLNIIKGRELFMDIIKIADEKGLRVYFLGGFKDEAEKAKQELIKVYKNIKIQANSAPKYGNNGQPATEKDRNLHKSLISKIKMFEPDLIFVGLSAPKQEKWIFRNFFRLDATGAMAVGGTFNYISKTLPFPPKWMEKLGFEWLWRLILEPKRLKRIINAVIVFPLAVFKSKFIKYDNRK
ncbi:MAG: WecB/TagA/CpsF family glycosyltransferase [Candidatus Woesebacteria bacterium]|nr:WecB/TagA/CpsF family glycosyltransferase [Candidatus Woesebacteria bacterium]